MTKSEILAKTVADKLAKTDSPVDQNFGIGQTIPRALGSANRRVLRERAEAEALSKIADVVTERQRKSEELRRLRMERDNAPCVSA